MKHYGDITALNGAELPVVDCITGGSPCQDLSIAGRREGLAGERSGLFMEQVRVVKEMREEDMKRGRTGAMVRPRFLVWENVPGAFSSNKGRDFQAVLTEIVRIAEPEAPDVPLPDKGKWPKAGCLYDDLGRWSVAWRVHDAQFWGVPQRRKRIALVADFRGLAAPEVLFERKGLSWHPDESQQAGEEAAARAGGGADRAVTLRIRGGCDGGGKGPLVQTEKSGTLGCNQDQTLFKLAVHQNASGEVREGDVAYTIGTNANASGRNTPMVYDARDNGDGQIAPTITGDHQNRVTDYTAVVVGNGQLNQISMAEQCNTLDTMHDQQAVFIPPVSHALRAKANCDFREDSETYVCQQTVRRLTPLECERLQGYPNGWTDIGEWVDSKGKKHREADSPRYKALGNSIALPFWFRLLRRISAQYERPATLGSLFDGIGGFPLCWERCNGRGTALWASEIEEFPIAVTKKHFPE